MRDTSRRIQRPAMRRNLPSLYGRLLAYDWNDPTLTLCYVCEYHGSDQFPARALKCVVSKKWWHQVWYHQTEGMTRMVMEIPPDGARSQEPAWMRTDEKCWGHQRGWFIDDWCRFIQDYWIWLDLESAKQMTYRVVFVWTSRPRVDGKLVRQ